MSNLTKSIPSSFDPTIYRMSNSDLISLSDEDLAHHYLQHGRKEGRIATAVITRFDFVDLINNDSRVLEIGPFDSPCITGQHVDYLDLLSQSELQNRALELQRNPQNVPEIKWIVPDGTLDEVTEKYDVLFSCHNLEHQIDLVEHFQQANQVLNNEGYYFLIVPDSRYCFDHYLVPSSIADVLHAHSEKRTTHTLKSVIEHRVLTTHNDPIKHWSGEHGDIKFTGELILSAISEYEQSHGILDVHAWQFTPISFEEIMSTLSELGLINFEIVEIYPTLRNEFEFKAILRNKN